MRSSFLWAFSIMKQKRTCTQAQYMCTTMTHNANTLDNVVTMYM